MGRPLRLAVAVSDERGRRFPTALAAWLARVAPSRAGGAAVNVAIVGDAQVRRLNRRYRGRAAVTDVLSFPARTPGEPPLVNRPPLASRKPLRLFLGDIVIAQGRARRQAARVGHSEQTELRVLALHGLLHLLGYDHERDDGKMARLERRLRRKGGLAEGLIERS